jgi:hypothetical protein
MIDINGVAKLEDKALLDRIAKEKERQERTQKDHRETHDRVLREIEAGKEKAEKAFPDKLKLLEENIAYAIQNNRQNVQFTCFTYDESVRDEWMLLYLKIMMAQALPLKGLACRFSKDDVRDLIISW